MCLSCGCHEYDNDHGDKDNIVLEDVARVGGPEQLSGDQIQRAADAANIPADKAKENVEMDFAAATR